MTEKRDLFLLFADLDAENGVTSLLRNRPFDLGIREISFDYKRHAMRDSGCFRQADTFLRSFLRTHSHAIVIFDHHGCGVEGRRTSTWIEDDVEGRLARNGWERQHVACVVLEPELEAWVWSHSTAVAKAFGFDNDYSRLERFLEQQGVWVPGKVKPKDPKAAVQLCLQRIRRPHSACLYSTLASSVPLEGCEDRAFAKLVTMLQSWFASDKEE